MRAFLAIVPPQEVVAEVEQFLRPRRDSDQQQHRDWRWTLPEQLHLTLAFLPELTETAADQLLEAGRRWASRREPLPVRVQGAGAFPTPDRARVLWLGVGPEEAAAELRRWARALRDAAGHAGAVVGGTPFSPHLTVARSGRPKRAGRWVQALDTVDGPGFTVSEVVLIESHLGEGPRRRPRYEVRAVLPLGGAAPS